MVAIPFENEQKLPIGDPFHPGGSITKRRFQVPLPEIVRFANMAIDINDPHGAFLSSAEPGCVRTASPGNQTLPDARLGVLDGRGTAYFLAPLRKTWF
jgi:hypothetical protein